jgi:hypothetical protein
MPDLNMMMGMMLGPFISDLGWYILHGYNWQSRLAKKLSMYQSAKDWDDWINVTHLDYILSKKCHRYYGEEYCFCEN